MHTQKKQIKQNQIYLARLESLNSLIFCIELDLPQVYLFFNLDLFVTFERSEVISSDEVARASAKPTGQGRIIGKDFQKV